MHETGNPPATAERPASLAGDALNVGRGLLMGAADIIPGVSGGTVALIVGIYERLVTAISRFDLDLVGLVRRREWSAAARHVDLRFLVTLGLGIAIGIGALGTLMEHLLREQTQPTYAGFLGLILASCLLVGLMIERWSFVEVLLLAAGGAFAYWLVGLTAVEAPSGLGYVFVCGVIAICAMILPGISGAFILLILGLYADITGLIKDAVHFRFTGEGLVTIAVFAAGCALGLLGFSKLLRWLLARYGSPTMAVLCGFMAGSLRKIWPFKGPVAPGTAGADEASGHAKFDLRPNVWPESFGTAEWTCVGIAIVAFAMVLMLHALGRPRK